MWRRCICALVVLFVSSFVVFSEDSSLVQWDLVFSRIDAIDLGMQQLKQSNITLKKTNNSLKNIITQQATTIEQQQQQLNQWDNNWSQIQEQLQTQQAKLKHYELICKILKITIPVTAIVTAAGTIWILRR